MRRVFLPCVCFCLALLCTGSVTGLCLGSPDCLAPPSSSGKFEGLRSVAETVAHNNRRAEIKALLQAGVEAVPSRATLDLDNIADYLATCYPEGTLSPIHWVAPSQSIDDTTKEQFTHGHIFLFTGNFEQGQKFFYDTARQLDGDPATVLDQMRRLHGIGTLASEKIHAEFSNNIRLQGHSCFRFADILFWHRLEIAGLRYTFEHVLPQDAPNILSLNNAVMNEEKELLIDLNEMQDWVAKNPRTIVARNPQGGIVGFIFVSLLRSEDFPWTYKEMIQAHDSVHQATRNTMVDFWVVASRSVPGIGKNLPLMTEKLARQIGGIRYLIAYSRPAYLEQALIQDELEKHLARWEHIHGADRTALNASMEEWLAQCIQRDAAQIAGSVEGAEMWGVIADLHTLKDFELAYLRYRRILNRYHLRQTPRPSYESLFEGSDLNCYTPGQLDIYRYASQRHLLLSRPDRRTIHPKTGQAISYTRYLGLLDEKPEFLKHSKGLDRSMESYQYFVAPRGTDAYLQYRQSHPDVTLAQFCQRMGRTPEEKVLVGLHQGNNAVLAGEIFPGRPEDPRSLGCNSLTAYIGDINNIPALAHLPAPRNTRQPEIVPVQDALITGSM